MNMNIKHKHAGHVIIIDGQAFKANDSGMWNLTDIWRTLKLPARKGPGKWAELKEAQRLAASGKVESSNGRGTLATKQAAIRYAAWVSSKFEDLVYDAFEAILEMPEVALLVADKMRNIGHDHSAAILERHIFNDKSDWYSLGRRTPKKLTAQQQEQHRLFRAAQRNDRKSGAF
ncbi:KilA-N domain-containing protein [Pseudomonas fluorescens]|nr:KilA-N domain-containing protein [Pseudomonas fluorescens]